MYYFFVVIIVVGLGYFVAWPLLASDSTEATPDHHLAPDEAALQRALASAEFDLSTGKIDEGEFQRLRAPLLAQLEAFQIQEQAAAPALDELELEVLITRARRARAKKAASPRPVQPAVKTPTSGVTSSFVS